MRYHDQDDVIGFCGDYRHPYGCEDATEVEVQTVAEGPLTPGPGSEHLQQAAADFLRGER
jgi:hypothetical protein